MVITYAALSSSGANWDSFTSTDVQSISVNGNAVDLDRVPHRWLDLYWGTSGYSIASNPPAHGADITQYLDAPMGLYIDDNADHYLHFQATPFYSPVSDCTSMLCGNDITSADNVTVTAVYYGVTILTAASAPTNLVATPGDGQVSIAFTAPADDGGSSITNYEYSDDGGSNWSAFSPAATSSPVVITGLTNGTSYSIKLRAVNSVGSGAESAAVSVQLGSPATEFAANETVIQQMVQADAMRSLSTLLAMNRNMVRDARGRLVSSQQGQASRDIPFDIDGSFIATRDGISTQGSFFQQSGDAETGTRRLIFGDFLVQRDEESGSTTATLDARVAWERMVDDATMLGYFIGAELAHSNLEGSFTGDQDRYGMTVGAYAVHALSESLFVDGYATLGAGQNDLEASNGVLALESDYSTWTVSLGGAVTGVISQPGYDFLPELAFNYGRTQIGQVGFTGTAYGVVDNTLSLDAGDVSIASLTFRPEIQVSLDGGPVARAETVFSFSPRLICEEVRMATTSSNCGTGLELGLSSAYNDGLGSLDMRLMRDWVGDATRTSFRLRFEHRF